MSRRRRTTHASLTPARALRLLLTILDDTSDAKWRIAQCRDALVQHVNAALDRKRRTPRAKRPRVA